MKSEIAVQLLWTLAAIFSLGAVFIAWAWRERDGKRRIWTTFALEGLILAGVFVPAYLGGGWLVAAAVALAGAAGVELYRTLERAGGRPLRALGFAAMLGLIAVGALRPAWLPVVAALLLPAVGALGWLARSATPDAWSARLHATGLGIVYPGLCLAFVVDLGAMQGGFGYLVLCYGLVEVNDSAAFLVGSALGKRKIFPTLSPNKTLEGSLGGLVATLGAAFALRFAVPSFSTPVLVAGAVLLAVAGQAGDLFASRIKRRAAVKDFGDAVPTHGGWLDVYDSFLFTAPLFYLFVRLTGSS